MVMARGTPNIKRVHAKNYIQKEADKRLKEVIKPYQQQGLNALGVDNYEVELYLKQMSSRVCTCRQIQTELPEMGVDLDAAPVYSSGIATEQEISIDWSKPLFGEPNEARFTDMDASSDEYEIVEDVTPHIHQTIESSPDCGICYRTGFIPGFEQYGKVRHVFTTYDIVDQNSFNIDRGTAPHVFNKLCKTGWVDFALTIPRYFKSVSYSIRNNHEILTDKLYLNLVPLTLDDLKQNAGRKIYIRVKAEQFTHLDIVFDLGSDPILANIAQLSKVTDWTNFDTTGNLQVILPMTIKELPVGSLILIPSKNIGLRVVDVQYLRPADGRNLDWSCNTRVMQPMEATKHIAKAFKLI